MPVKQRRLCRLDATIVSSEDVAVTAHRANRGGYVACQLLVPDGRERIDHAFGSVDFCADLGYAHRREVLLPARFELVLASRLGGIAAPIDGVTVRLDDMSETSDDAAHARDMGMRGKLCIHPKQIAAVRAAFAPSAGEVDWARRVLASGHGAVQVEGEMVDEPVRIRARLILQAASEIL